MGLLEKFLTKVGFSSANEEPEDNETYTEPKTAQYAQDRSALGASGVRLSSDLEESDANRSLRHRNTPAYEKKEEPVKEKEAPSPRYANQERTTRIVSLPSSNTNHVKTGVHTMKSEEIRRPKSAEDPLRAMVVTRPESFEDAKAICDQLKAEKPVLVNMELTDHVSTQRLADFLFGAVYAMEGSVQPITEKIFLLAPGSVDISIMKALSDSYDKDEEE